MTNDHTIADHAALGALISAYADATVDDQPWPTLSPEVAPAAVDALGAIARYMTAAHDVAHNVAPGDDDSEPLMDTLIRISSPLAFAARAIEDGNEERVLALIRAGYDSISTYRTAPASIAAATDDLWRALSALVGAVYATVASGEPLWTDDEETTASEFLRDSGYAIVDSIFAAVAAEAAGQPGLFQIYTMLASVGLSHGPFADELFPSEVTAGHVETHWRLMLRTIDRAIAETRSAEEV